MRFVTLRDEVYHWKFIARLSIVKFQNYNKAMELVCILQQMKAEERGWA